MSKAAAIDHVAVFYRLDEEVAILPVVDEDLLHNEQNRSARVILQSRFFSLCPHSIRTGA